MRRFRRAHRPRGLIRDVSFTGNHDALTAGICSRSVDLVRSAVGRLRNHHPAAHRKADETSVRQVLQMELAALGRRGDHINTHESRTVRGVRYVFLFGCGYAALGLYPNQVLYGSPSCRPLRAKEKQAIALLAANRYSDSRGRIGVPMLASL